MKLRYLFILNTIVALIFAAGLLLAPKTMLGLFGISVGATVSFNASLNFVAQLLGAALTLPGLLGWFAAGMTDASARRSVAVSLFVFQVIGFAVSLLGMLSKVMSITGWSIVGLFLVFALGYAFFIFVKQSDI
jgi:hypothetical protein